MRTSNIIWIVLGIILFSFPLLSNAEQLPNTGQYTPPPNTGQYSPSQNTPSFSNQGFSVQNPLKATSFAGLVKGLLDALIIIGIPVAVLFIVFAGFKFVTALGNPEKLTIAKKNLLYTVIGIAIFLGAWLIAQVIFNTVTRLGAGV